ncbi:ATP-dependent helicase/nuclease subunit A [Polystyrenella longa]|uniref:DNA 3'-5' helicase n=1 Tax=Polystyrenella longa TaxID=2528007 RepID=A0A518CR09_9PLAN|nr:UvrD-helicase domain-containing protein [Polystyrenella longa]QDU81648.1 ATP-dependent helicase/nuclease subunit A [Polystyrenella longa]
MSPRFTDQQAKAINTRDVSIALAAGAGCGKTFVLTHRFLSYLDPTGEPDPLSRIVAITFTERAAREMRHRIREACREALQQCDEQHVDYWLRILRGLETARITTIHSFCSGFLRRHAVDAGLDPQFGLIEPAFAEPLLVRQINETLHQKLEERDEDALALIREYGLERTSQHIQQMVYQRFQIETHQFELQDVPQAAESWIQYYKEIFQPALIKELMESNALKRVHEVLSNNVCGAPKMEERRKIIVSILDQFTEWPNPLAPLQEIRENLNLKGARANHWEEDSTQEELKLLFKSVKDDIDKILEFDSILEDDIEPIIELGQQLFRLGQHASWAYAEYKREQGLLDFDDLLLLTRNLLRDLKSLRIRAADGIEYLMVDEFQDTDPVQTDVVRFLCEQQLLTGKLFLVGDVKQSIYRFRRADPQVFLSLRQEVPEKGRLPLSTNFRSQPEILRFVNVLFFDEVEENYEALQPFSPIQLTPTPTIEFLWADENSWEKKANASVRRRIEAETIAHRIQQMLQDETPRIRTRDPETNESILRRTEPGDIVILFRAMSNVGLYEEALRNLDLDYYLVGGRAFYAQQEVFDFINICQVLDDPTDEISLAGVLRSPFFGLDDDTIFSLKYQPKSSGEEHSLLQAITTEPPAHLPPEQQQQIRQAARVLTELRSQKDQWTLVKLFRYLLEETGYDASLLHEFMGARKVANLRKLIDMARQFDRSGLYTLSDFVVRLKTSLREESKEELATTHPETSDVVRLMTVHQSKGLEFPVVIVSDCAWEPSPQHSAVAFHPHLGPLVSPPTKQGESKKSLGQQINHQEEKWADKEEYKRLFYVATTRAADILMLSAAFESGKSLSSPWMQLLERKFDLQTGLLKGDPLLGQIAKPGLNRDEIPHVKVWREKPEIRRDQSTQTTRRIPLSEFEKLVADAEPISLPELLTPIDPSLGGQQVFSVSLIEQVVEQLFQHETELPKPDRSETSLSSIKTVPTTTVDQATTLGDIVHAVTERLQLDQDIDLTQEINRACEQLHVPVKEEVRQRAKTCLNAFVSSNLMEEWRTAREIHRELDFLLKWPPGKTGETTKKGEEPILISGQIDCLFQTENGGWRMWDYKTGIRSDKAYLLHHYRLQLTLYAAAVEQLLGTVPERMELIHLGQQMTPIEYMLYPETVTDLYQQVSQAIDYLRSGQPLPTG